MPGGRYPLHVRFSDVDVYGHVNNVKYFEYFQEARIQLMVAQGRELGDGYHLVVAQTDVDYKLPILFRHEPYDCRTWVSRIGSTSVVFESVVLRRETRCCPCHGRGRLLRQRDRPPGRRSRRRSASSPPAERRRRAQLQRVHHELGGVRDVVPEPLVLLGRELGRVQAGAEVRQPVLGGVGVTSNGAWRIRSRGCPRVSPYVVGPPQYCMRNSVKRSSAGPRSSSGYIGRSTSSSATPS